MAATNLLKKSFINIKNITKGMFSLTEGLNKSQSYTAKINKDILKGNERKKNYIRENSISFKRKVESSRRRKGRDIIELTKVGAVFRAPAKAIANTTKGFFGRILDFAGTIMAGWLIYNLPTIDQMGKELSGRVITLTGILQNFIPNSVKLFSAFGGVISAYLKNFLSLDFKDSENRVDTAMKNLNDTFFEMKGSFDEVMTLLKTPLTTGLGGRPDSPAFGTDYSKQQGGGGKLQPIHKQALDIISGPESGGSYNAMNQGTINDKIVGSTLNSESKIGKNLTDMSIGEVLQRQQWLMNKSNPQVSNYGVYAAGRYQFIPNTLPGVMKSAGLTPQDKFSPENQDLMAIALLKERGIQPWTVGGSKYSAKERAIVEQARTTPTQSTPSRPTVTPQTPLSTNFAQVTGTSGTVKYNGREGAPVSVPYSPFKPGSGAVITSTMGYRGSSGTYHKGYDLAAAPGTPLYAYFPGKVTHIGLDGTASSAGYGNWVVWKDDLYGSYHFFGHMINKPPVRLGQIVNQGTLMGNVGSTGRSTGPHLHWEISSSPPQANGQFSSYEDPGAWLRKHPLKKVEGQPQSPQISPPSQSQPSPPTPSPAQISPSPRKQTSERLVQEETSESYVVPFVYPQPQIQSSGGMVSGSGQENVFYDDTSLNRFITKKLLLDLAYT